MKNISLASSYPNVAKEWHPTKNGNLLPENIAPKSGIKVWWICEKGHEWEAVVSNRSNGTCCPYCSRYRANKENNLIISNPELAKEWHPIKNGNLNPDNVLAGSKRKVWWKCVNGHEWYGSIANRTILNRRCPYCSGRYASLENNLAIKNPELAKEWHPTKNGKLTPNNVTPKTHKKIWWICSKGHEWQARPARKNNGIGCPYCTGLYPTAENNLAVLYPEIVKEIHPDKNGKIDSFKISPHSHKKLWWKCENGHEWLTMISERTGKEGHKCGCPHCHKQYSLLELRIYTELLYYFKNILWHDKSFGVEIDVFLPDKEIGIEADGGFWHKDRYEKDKEKTNYLLSKGAKLIRLRELPLKKITNLDISYSGKMNQLDIIKILFYNLSNLLHDERLTEYQNTADFKNHNFYIEMLGKLKFPQKSIIDVVPELKKEWHPFKNKLGPEKYSYGSNEKAWWVCKNKHEWEAVINSRTIRKVGCPYCSYKKVNEENCLAATNPELASQWHPAKNVDITPYNTCIGSAKSVWWICEKGHEWQTKIVKRKIGHNCPYCVNQKVNKDNCLATTNSELAKEWHPIKNGKLTPNDVVNGSNKKVWWACKCCGYNFKSKIQQRRKCPKCHGDKNE
jgi:hypothetical protein